jgi:hypothetical protein
VTELPIASIHSASHLLVDPMAAKYWLFNTGHPIAKKATCLWDL